MKWICNPSCTNDKPVLKGGSWTVVTGLLTILMPKCAFCWAIYMGLLSSIGLSAIPYKPWFLPLAIVLFVITLAKLLYNAIRNRHFAAFIIALAAGIMIVVQKLWIPIEALN